MIYPVDSIIHPLNNRALMYNKGVPTLTLPKESFPSSVIASALYNAFISSASIVLTPGLLDMKKYINYNNYSRTSYEQTTLGPEKVYAYSVWEIKNVVFACSWEHKISVHLREMLT